MLGVVAQGRVEYVAGVDIGKLTRNERRCLELCQRFPNAMSCGGDHGPSAHFDLAERLLAAEALEAALVAEFGDCHKYTLLGGLAAGMPEADVAEAARLYPNDEVEAERFLWRRFTESHRAARGAHPPEPSKRCGPDHAREQRRREQAKASRKANRRR